MIEQKLQNGPKKVRTRFAPSPTGMMHIGGVRTAIYEFLEAKKHNGVFLLRIEDTDRKRLVEGSVEDIVKNLKWLGLIFDEGPVYQSERKEIYQKYTKELVDKDLAYESEGAIWFKIPKEGKVSFTDLIGNRKIEFENNSQKDFVILKSDGFPTYHLAHVVDDHLMEINPVVRAEEWLSSTPKHILLFNAFGWKIPNYAHLPLILGKDRSKLSKRHGSKGVSEFRESGFLPEAILNYMALLSWTPPSKKEMFTLEEMAREFDLKDVHITPAIFDIEKLEWMNGVYIRSLSDEGLLKKLKQFDPKLEEADLELLKKIIPLAKTRIKTLGEFSGLTAFFFGIPEVTISQKEKKVAQTLLKKLSQVKKWEKDEILSVLREVLKEENVKMSVIYKILTGKEEGLPLPESLEILGKERVLKQLSSF